MAVAKKAKRGRPALPKSRRRHMIGVHVVDEMRDRLEREAKAAGRSLSNHVEALIEKSFDRRGLLRDVLEARYGSHIAGLLLEFGLVMSWAATWVSGARAFDQDDQVNRSLERWSLSDPIVRSKALRAVQLLAGKHLPSALPEAPSVTREEERHGQEFAAKSADALFALLETDIAENEGGEFHEIRALLGSISPPITRERAPGGRPGKLKDAKA